MFNFTSKIKNKEESLEDEFEKFDNKFKPDQEHFNSIKQVFEAYITDKEFKEKIDNKKFAELNLHTSGEYFLNLPKELKDAVPKYINDNVNLEKFIDA